MTRPARLDYFWQWLVGSVVAGRCRGGVGNAHHLRRRAAGAQKMKPNLYTRLYLWLVAHRRLVLGVTVLIAAVIAIVISLRIDLEEDILDMLPQHDQLRGRISLRPPQVPPD